MVDQSWDYAWWLRAGASVGECGILHGSEPPSRDSAWAAIGTLHGAHLGLCMGCSRDSAWGALGTLQEAPAASFGGCKADGRSGLASWTAPCATIVFILLEAEQRGASVSERAAATSEWRQP